MGFFDLLNPATYITKPLEWAGVTDIFSNNDEIEAAKENNEESKELWNQTYDKITGPEGYLSQYLSAASGRYNEAEYNQALSGLKNASPYQAGSFSYNGNINDFTSPASALRVKTAMDQITKSKANAGDMFSSDYLNALNAQAQSIASEEYNNAYERMMKDRSTNLQEWQANQGEAYKAYQSEMDKLKDLYNINASDRNSWNDAYDNYFTQLINAEMAKTQGITNINASNTNLDLQKDNPYMNMLNMGTQIAGVASKFGGGKANGNQ